MDRTCLVHGTEVDKTACTCRAANVMAGSTVGTACPAFVQAVGIVQGRAHVRAVESVAGNAISILIPRIKVRTVVYPVALSGVIHGDERRRRNPLGPFIVRVHGCVVMTVRTPGRGCERTVP